MTINSAIIEDSATVEKRLDRLNRLNGALLVLASIGIICIATIVWRDLPAYRSRVSIVIPRSPCCTFPHSIPLAPGRVVEDPCANNEEEDRQA